MTRIIAGSARGRRLRTPAGGDTRPTTDRVREALFSALEASLGSLAGLRFLDLYAGSGAVGLEAMSRGAGVATLVESDRRTARLVQANADTLEFRRAEVVSLPVARAMAQPPRAPYDVVFLDPPYALDSARVGKVLLLLVDHGWLAHGATVVVERSARDLEPLWPLGIVAGRSRSYGETVLWWAAADSTQR
ncbi:MAG: 16S rRNA (guanine(966)-N(2))-methyltransferase RsmD [Marmoricola sp.]